MTQDQIDFVTKGNKDAAAFLLAYITHCHLLDDFVDKDKPVDAEGLVEIQANFTMQMAGNAFFSANRAMLVPLMLTAYAAWLDSNQMAESGSSEVRLASDVLKGYYHEVVWFSAFLLGGWAHYRTVTTRFREYDYDHKPAEEEAKK